jgi:hypothetical protein
MNRSSSRYASAAAKQNLLAASRGYREQRLVAKDMISIEAAAELLNTNKIQIESWAAAGRVIGLRSERPGLRMPRWQFDPVFLQALPRLSTELGTHDGWALLTFLESPLGALNGRSPRQAIEQGEVQRVVLCAQTDGS